MINMNDEGQVMRDACRVSSAAGVAQISNLLYRRFPTGKRLAVSAAAECAVAVQNGILRYSRLEICATKKAPNTFDRTWGDRRRLIPQAFTLVELLIVIAIIAILAALTV